MNQTSRKPSGGEPDLAALARDIGLIVERHAGWACWTAEDYAKPNRVTVHGLLP